MARAYRVPQKMMKIYRSDKGNSNVIEIFPNNNDFKEGDPILLSDYACRMLSNYYFISSNLFKHAVVGEKNCNCPDDHVSVQFLNVTLTRPTFIDKSLIKKLIK